MTSLPKTLTITINLDDLEFNDEGRATVEIGTSRPASNLSLTVLGERVLDMLWKKSTPRSQGWVSRSVLIRGLGNVVSRDLDDELDRLEAAGRVERRVTPTSTKPLTEWRITIDGGIFQR